MKICMGFYDSTSNNNIDTYFIYIHFRSSAMYTSYIQQKSTQPTDQSSFDWDTLPPTL